MNRNPTRRTMIAGMAAAPIVAAPALAAASPAGDEAAFDRAYAAMLAADAEQDRYEQTVTTPVMDAMRPAFDRVPHVRADYGSGSDAGYLTTERPDDLARAFRYISTTAALDRREGRSRRPRAEQGDYMRACRRVVAHDLRRQREFCRIRRAHGWSTVSDHADTLSERYLDAADVLYATPPVTIRQAALKAATILERTDPCDPYMTTLVADLGRMAGIEVTA